MNWYFGKRDKLEAVDGLKYLFTTHNNREEDRKLRRFRRHSSKLWSNPFVGSSEDETVFLHQIVTFCWATTENKMNTLIRTE